MWIRQLSGKNMAALAIGAALMFGMAATLTAHHSVTAVFDTDKHVQIKGEFTDVEWVNPHVFLYMKAPDDKGKMQDWKFESGPPAFFRRSRVNRKTFTDHIGQMATIDGLPAKDGSNYVFVQKVTFADGDVVESVSAAEAAKGGR